MSLAHSFNTFYTECSVWSGSGDIRVNQGFPGGAVVKNPPANAWV